MDESISLRELVDVGIVQAIQDSFAKTVGVSSVIFLPDGDALTRFSNPIKFCSLIQSTKEGRRRCFQSFAEMSRKAVELSEPEIMYCFAYAAHFVAPIIIDGERKATMYAGQFKPEKFSPEQLKELEEIAVEIDLDPELLVKEAKNMHTVGDEVALDCLHSFFRTVKVIAELGAQALELRQTKDALQEACDGLEVRVEERTAELAGANEELRQEVVERKAMAEALRESETKYRLLTETLKDAILSFDMDGRITYLNRAAIELGGYSEEEALQMNITDILPEDQLSGFYERFSMRAAGGAKIFLYETDFINKAGERISVEVNSSMITEDGGPFKMLLACRDITRRKAAEEQIKRSLREKEVLMHEIHHRVKNNLQVVSSLISMQARATRNKEAIDVLSKSQSRINTIALIHTQLYESEDLSELNMKEFVGTLSEQLFRSYQVNDAKIARIVRVADLRFPSSVGVYVGLIINELLSNALKHAFGERKNGKIEVSLTASEGGRVNLRVSDDGVGLPPGFDINKTGSLGLHLVKILVEDQLQGTLEVTNEGGATFNMKFDLKDSGGSSYGEDKNTDR